MAAVVVMSNVPIGAAPYRCAGVLAAGTVLGAATYKERFLVQGATSIRAIVKLSAVAGTATLKITPVLADAQGTVSDTEGTAAATNIQTTATLTTAETALDYTLAGERFVDVSIVSGTSGTITFVDVFLKA